MRTFFIFLLLPLLSLAQNPELNTPVGEKAFHRLPAHYNKSNPINIDSLINDYNSENLNIRKEVADYIYALFIQSFADENSDRDVFIDSPFFGEGSKSQAREFRANLGEAFSQSSTQNNSGFPIIEWLIYKEMLPKNKAYGIEALSHLKTPKSDSLLIQLIDEPILNRDILMGALSAIKERDLSTAKDALIKLSAHHRTEIRDSVRSIAKTFGFEDELLAFEPVKAITPWMDSVIMILDQMILEDVPEDAQWIVIDYSDPGHTRNNETFTEAYQGWILEEEDSLYKILDYSGQVLTLWKANANISSRSFEESLEKHIKFLKSEERRSPFGRALLESHEGATTLPDFTMLTWAYTRGLKQEATEILFLLLNSYKDDEWLLWIGRDYFGHLYHNEMLHAYSFDLDYTSALKYAHHLTEPIFDEYSYQPRAIRLKDQLLKYRDIDFKSVRLPSFKEWEAFQASHSRTEQIEFLAKRLRLLQCIQPGQPAGISYFDQQFKRGTPVWTRWEKSADSIKVINPFEALFDLELTIAELPLLIPFMKEDLYIPSFSYWRDFRSGRELHRVNYLISQIMQYVVIFDLAELSTYYKLDDNGKKAHLDSIRVWCEENAHVTNFELITNVIRNEKNWSDFDYALTRCLKSGYDSLSTDIAKRLTDFDEGKHEDIYEVLYKLQSRDIYDIMEKGLEHEEKDAQMWCSLYMMQFDSTDNNKGEPVLSAILKQDDGKFRYPKVFSFLLYIGTPRAFTLAENILNSRAYTEDQNLWPYQEVFLNKLIVAKSEKALNYVIDGLLSDSNNQYDDPRCNDYLSMVAGWRKDNYEYNTDWTDQKKKEEAEKTARWLQQQFKLIKADKEHYVNNQFEGDRLPVSFLDSP